MKILKNTKNISNKSLVPLGKVHLYNYGVIYCDDNLDPLEVEEVEKLKKSLTYKDIGILADLLEEKLNRFFSEKGLFSKNIWINSLTVKDGFAELTVDSDYFENRIGYRISTENGLNVSICPWADEDFSEPFIEAFKEWLNGDSAVSNHYRYLER